MLVPRPTSVTSLPQLRRGGFAAFVMALSLAAPSLAQGFVNFESPQMHPVRVSPDGSRLLSVLTSEARLCVWSLADPDAPVLLSEIPSGWSRSRLRRVLTMKPGS